MQYKYENRTIIRTYINTIINITFSYIKAKLDASENYIKVRYAHVSYRRTNVLLDNKATYTT